MENRELFLTITFAIYAFEGFLLIICNGMVELVLIKHRHLRRQYIILFAQIFADTTLGFGFCLAGIGRLIVLGLGCFRITRRSCLLLPWSTVITWSELMSAISTLMVSTDRIISLLFPMRYFEKNYSYQIKQETSLRLFEARQCKLTITMGVSCVFTLFFYVIPLCIKLLIGDNDDDPTTYYSELIRVAVAISCNLNPLTNIAAILIKQDDIACHVRQLFPECIQKSIYKCDQITLVCGKSVTLAVSSRTN
ncbi:unnamed protein product [Brugia timori]|uniref:G_PROTEIN_RECEP_F1_2 domain-containing protein n=1 Tax=Brugia timori TaxID=42155 RepID=A0A0R3QKY2_9BILA|nr:unnamed protein product [Brugia timori]